MLLMGVSLLLALYPCPEAPDCLRHRARRGAPVLSARHPRNSAGCLAHGRHPITFLERSHDILSRYTQAWTVPGKPSPSTGIREPSCIPHPPAPGPTPGRLLRPCLPSAPLTLGQVSGKSSKSSSNSLSPAEARGNGCSSGSRCCPPRWLRKGLGERGAQRLDIEPHPLTQLFLWKVGVRGFWTLNVPDLGPLRGH